MNSSVLLSEKEANQLPLSNLTQTTDSLQIRLEHFMLTSLPPQSQDLLQLVIQSPSRLTQYIEQPEEFWNWAEQMVGPFTQTDRWMLETLAEFFLFQPDGKATIQVQSSNAWFWSPE